ncbi:hypothetical protein F3Y22_tig00110216pilonHSYRG00040 [Hibiscus syriacus]|uniref:Uncharacterized protein n=1 Tax=Hibiscus syriacus TaxID=106335 RepID=A0A6A3BAX1_HIBSY|nr:hypothetical protein F3Y22_tig00110216pilonHSYRG00040 [Hibiscus syriacus]
MVVNGEQDTIYGILKAHGLPKGLLPKGITRFDFDDTGRFEVHLDQPCKTKFESEMHYDRNVSGTLSYGQIGELSGISAQELFLWFPVKGIRVDYPNSGLIYFDVGVVFKQFPLSLFESPRDCLAVQHSESGHSIGDVELSSDAISKSAIEEEWKIWEAIFKMIVMVGLPYGKIKLRWEWRFQVIKIRQNFIYMLVCSLCYSYGC